MDLRKVRILFFALLIFAAFSKTCFAAGLTVENVDFVKDGQKIMKISEGTVSASVTVSGESGQRVIMVAALYDGDAVKKCRVQNYTTEKNGENILPQKTMDGVQIGNTMRVFVLGGNLTPLCDSVCLSEDRKTAALFYLKKYDSLMTQENLEATAGLYDTVSGGYYCSYSAKTYNPFEADIESTAQMIDYLKCTGLLWEMPSDLKTKFITFFQTRQSSEDGYFYDPRIGTDETDSKRERNFTKSADALRWLGAEPLYPLPTERIQTLSAPEQYQSEENFRAWLSALPWDTYPYGAGNTLVSSMTTIKAYGYGDIAVNYVSAIQNTETGFWGDGLSYDTLNAAMKISGVFDKQHPFPNLEKTMDSTIYVARNCQAPTASSIWNILMLINTAKNTYADGSEYADSVVDKNLAEITKVILKTVETFMQKDGLYAYTADGNSLKSQGSLVSLGMEEGNVNGNLLCSAYMWIQANWLYKITPSYSYVNLAEHYFDILKNSAPPEKIDYFEQLCNESFDDMTANEAPTGFRAQGTAAVLQDDKNNANKFLAIGGTSTQMSAVSYVMPSRPILSMLTMSQKIKIVEKGSPKGQWYFVWGAGNNLVTVELIISSDTNAENSATLKMRTSDNPSISEDIAQIEIGKWYNLKIEYKPDGLLNTKTLFYLDNTLIWQTSSFFNGGDSSVEPQILLNGLSIGKYSYTGGMLYIDDLNITIQ